MSLNSSEKIEKELKEDEILSIKELELKRKNQKIEIIQILTIFKNSFKKKFDNFIFVKFC